MPFRSHGSAGRGTSGLIRWTGGGLRGSRICPVRSSSASPATADCAALGSRVAICSVAPPVPAAARVGRSLEGVAALSSGFEQDQAEVPRWARRELGAYPVDTWGQGRASARCTARSVSCAVSYRPVSSHRRHILRVAKSPAATPWWCRGCLAVRRGDQRSALRTGCRLGQPGIIFLRPEPAPMETFRGLARSAIGMRRVRTPAS